MGMNSHVSPREDNVREYLRSLQRRDTQLDRAQFADKGRDTLLDGYTKKQLEAVCCNLWARGSSSPECYFRTLVDVLLGHYMLTRGGDRRSAEISDLFTFEFPDEGPTRCMPLVYTTREGKVNQHGRLETSGALRHKNPFVCVISSLAFYLLYRWDLTDESFPDFATRPAWYGIRLIKRTGGDREQQLSYTSQRDWAGKAFEQVGVHSSKTTHIGRPSGAKIAEIDGVSEEQIRRAGRWNQDQMVGCYLNSLPREFMRKMAGHPIQAGCFEIRSASAAPPDALLSLIWPELDIWKGRFGPDAGQVDDLAAAGFTNLLFYLREVILQDSVALRLRFPDNAVWTHPVFQHAAYEPYARQVAACLHEGESPNELSMLHQAMPQLMEYLKAMEVRNAQQVAKQVSEQVAQQVAQIEQSAAKRDTEMQRLVSRIAQQQQHTPLQLLTSAGGLTLRLEISPEAAAAAAAAATATATTTSARPYLLPAALSLDESGTSRYTSARASAAVSPEPQLHEYEHQDGQAEVQPPAHRMSRAIKTVERLWHEWTVGIDGGPSIRSLDSRWGSRWRAGRRSELQWYSLRLEAIKEVRRIAQAQRTSEVAAVWQLQHQQQKMGCSLDQLCKRLRTGRKA
jgi:hypothetical protein